MFVYQLTIDDSEVIVPLDSDHPDRYADIKMKGEAGHSSRKQNRTKHSRLSGAIDDRLFAVGCVVPEAMRR